MSFLNYILLIMLLQLFQFPPLPSSTQHPHSLRQSLHYCSCLWVMRISSLATPFPILYFTSLWLFCNYLFALLNPLTSLPSLPHPHLIWQPSKGCIHNSISVLVCLTCFLDSLLIDLYFLPFYCLYF